MTYYVSHDGVLSEYCGGVSRDNELSSTNDGGLSSSVDKCDVAGGDIVLRSTEYIVLCSGRAPARRTISCSQCPQRVVARAGSVGNGRR